MGAKSVTSTQYNNDDLQKAYSHVSVLPSSDGDITFQAELASSRSRAPAPGLLRDLKEIGLSDKDQPECVELDEIGCGISDTNIQQPVEAPAGLRRRILPKDSVDDVDRSSLDTDHIPPVEDLINSVTRLTCDNESSNQNTSSLSSRSEDDDDEVVVGHGKDPLLWFGILVPQPLRQSQVAFKNAIKLSCQIATLQNRLDQEKKNYQAMIARKHTLQAQQSKLLASETNQSVDQQENSPDAAASEECLGAE